MKVNIPKTSLISISIIAAHSYADNISICIDDPSQHQCTNPNSRFTCGLYLAQSTIPHSGLGVFTGIPHSPGSSIAPPEISHQLFMQFNGEQTPFSNPMIIHDYTWASHVSGATWEGEVETLIPGLGMAANGFLPMANAFSIMGSIDSAGVNTDKDGIQMGPGSGAFSPYHGLQYLAERAMGVGDEVFVNYGDHYFRGRPNVYGLVPLTPEFQTADELLTKLWSALNSSPILKSLMLDHGEEAHIELDRIWNVFRNDFVTDQRVSNALPSSVADIPRAAMHGTPFNFLRGNNPRSLEWLETNGYCMDTLNVGRSNIPHAGRGAFAKKAFVEGETILPLPMLHIDRSDLDIWRNGELYSKQLILNYSFGHKDSSLLLFPYSSSAGFINHGGKEANAKVVWAETDPTGFHQKEWKSMSPRLILDMKHTGLLMLVVATRPIQEGEEVTIDYGDEWQDAWERHVEDWDSSGIYRSAAELNESEKEIKTVFEDSYHPVATACHYRYQGAMESDEPADDDEDDDDDDDDGTVTLDDIPWIEAEATQWQDLGGRHTMSGDNFRPCVVLSRHPASSIDEEDTYTVSMFNRGGPYEFDKIPLDKPHFVKGIARRAILFVDIPESSVQQNAKTFRHEIGVFDELWPEAWKDKTLKKFYRKSS
ncbi:hypothetical protein ACHAWO_002996 [Cyclotella atomus]|uniref:SET domain-containing protein n=1 Tax=Cyclotella atomus TaxID=382360 RepID=A0ABD3R0F2_9STRA